MAFLREIRFGKLVETSGNPEVVTLWADPKTDRAFMKLVKELRVLTVIQKPTGTQKDFGLIGFHPQPFCSYLVFPRRIKEEGEVRVIGIKYDLLKKSNKTNAKAEKEIRQDEQDLRDEISKKVSKSIGTATKSPPHSQQNEIEEKALKVSPVKVKKWYAIKVRRIASVEIELNIEALNAADAKTQAIEEVAAKDFSLDASEVKNKITSVAQVSGDSRDGKRN